MNYWINCGISCVQLIEFTEWKTSNVRSTYHYILLNSQFLDLKCWPWFENTEHNRHSVFSWTGTGCGHWLPIDFKTFSASNGSVPKYVIFTEIYEPQNKFLHITKSACHSSRVHSMVLSCTISMDPRFDTIIILNHYNRPTSR